MRLKSVVLVACLSVFSSTFAASVHPYPYAKDATLKATQSNTNMSCHITVYNNSEHFIDVSGVYSSGLPLEGFRIYPHEGAHYIDLPDYGWDCGSMADVVINSPYYRFPYHTGHLSAGEVIDINYLQNKWQIKKSK